MGVGLAVTTGLGRPGLVWLAVRAGALARASTGAGADAGAEAASRVLEAPGEGVATLLATLTAAMAAVSVTEETVALAAPPGTPALEAVLGAGTLGLGLKKA